MRVAVAEGGSFSQTLSRGLCVLELLAMADEPMTLGELCTGLGIHRSVGYRLVRTLAFHKLVQPMERDRYALGVGLVSLARGVDTDLRRDARAILSELSEKLDATATLSVAGTSEVVILVSVEPRTSLLRVTYREGLRLPFARGAAGAALLSARPPAPGERSAVKHARKLGFAVSEGEIEKGTRAVSAPVLITGQQCRAVVTAVALASKLTDLSSAARATIEAARRVAEIAGHRHSLFWLPDT